MTLLLLALSAQATPIPIVGGSEAPPGAWPDAAGVGYSWGIGCTGVLVAPDVVLTAAHCASGVEYVVLDTIDLDAPGEQIPVTDALVHPDAFRTFDVAALLLARASEVDPRPIARECDAEAIADGTSAWVVGFGAINSSGTEYGSLLMQVEVPIVDADCSDLALGCRDEVSPGGELVAGGDGADSCSGDSGGPLYVDGKLAGIVSRGVSDADVPCGDGGVYVRADAIVDWLEVELGRDLARPDCGPDWNHAPEPTAAPIAMVRGSVGTTRIDPGDEDPGDSHAFSFVDPPPWPAGVVDGELIVLADSDATLEVRVTDDGDPPRSAVVSVPVTVSQPVGRDHGCSSAGASPSWAWLLVCGAPLATRARGAAGAQRTRGSGWGAAKAAARRALIPAAGIILGLCGCRIPEESDAPPAEPAVVADAWEVDRGDTLTVHAVVCSPRTLDQSAFMVCDPAGGLHSGLRIELRGLAPELPPAVGTAVAVRGTIVSTDPPTLAISDYGDVEIEGLGELTVVAADADPGLIYALVSETVRITSPPDPRNDALTDGPLPLFGGFAATPGGWNDSGTATGIVFPGGLALRTDADWDGERTAQPPMEVEISDLRALENGPAVQISGILATPWSTDARYALIQDDAGIGIWLDAEGFGPLGGSVGDRLTVVGGYRNDGEGPRVRLWTEPAVNGLAAPIETDALVDGAYVSVEVQVNNPPDETGDRRTAEEVYLGERFVSVDELVGRVKVTGPVRIMPDGRVRLFPVSIEE